MYHTPVLLEEVLKYLDPRPNQNFIDGTLGGGGHAAEILKKIEPNGRLLGIDADEDAIREVIPNFTFPISRKRFVIAQGNFRDMKKIALENNFKDVNGILLDLGVSSHQLDRNEKGFGFESDALDMRMEKGGDLTAGEIVNHWRIQDLITLFREYGEENLAKPIAEKIIEYRQSQSIHKPAELVAIVAEVYKKYYKKPSLKNPATKIFQALRIRVNNELDALKNALDRAKECLGKEGRLAVISYHSLEDRIVKEFFKKESKDCVCPLEYPVCQCDHRASLRIITKKPITATIVEIENNPRSRSAKLRIAQKI